MYPNYSVILAVTLVLLCGEILPTAGFNTLTAINSILYKFLLDRSNYKSHRLLLLWYIFWRYYKLQFVFEVLYNLFQDHLLSNCLPHVVMFRQTTRV